MVRPSQDSGLNTPRQGLNISREGLNLYSDFRTVRTQRRFGSLSPPALDTIIPLSLYPSAMAKCLTPHEYPYMPGFNTV